jgi:hypothetical protein
MKGRLYKLGYIVSTAFFGLLAVLFLGVMITSLVKNAIDIWVRVGWDWMHPGNYVGLTVGFLAYLVPLALMLIIPRFKHNLAWMLKFTHELTHTQVALLFFGKIREFVVRDRECYVSYLTGPVGYVPITLSPYCIPIYTFMLFPFRFAGDSHYMIVFDFLIAFSYAFHIHSFIKQTRFTQPDIDNCGKARSTAFITFVHAAVISLILATPKGGVMKAIYRVFWEYPVSILTDPSSWFHDVIRYF